MLGFWGWGTVTDTAWLAKDEYTVESTVDSGWRLGQGGVRDVAAE